MLTESNLRSLWNYVNQGAEFPWPRSQKGKEKLSKSISILVNDDEVTGALCTLDKDAFNLKIRELISPKLREGKVDQSVKIGTWTCNGFVPVTYLIMPPWPRMRAG